MSDPIDDYLHSLHAGRVLDIATGSGAFLRTLREHVADWMEMIGVDAKKTGIDAARESSEGDNITFRVMDAAKLDFRDNEFDTVTISNALHHMVSPRRVLAEMARVTAPGGRVIVSEMHRDVATEPQLTHTLIHDFWAAVDALEDIPHFPTFRREELIAMVENAGLCNVQVFDCAVPESDPHDEKLVSELLARIDEYSERVRKLDDKSGLLERAEELRARLGTVGIQWAPGVFLVGQLAR